MRVRACEASELFQQMQTGAANRMRRRKARGVSKSKEGGRGSRGGV